MLDVAIIGGGPAGAAAALSLRQLMPGAVVAIFDAGDGERWKPGETLSPAARPLLESLGCWGAFQQMRAADGAMASYGTRAAWGAPNPYEHDFLFGLHGNGWRLRRERFDAMLLGCAETAGAEVRRGMRLMDSVEEEAGWRLRFRGGEWRARFVIDASGRSARFAVQRGARQMQSDRLAGVFVLFQAESAADTLIEAAEGGWWYSTTVPGAKTVAAWMSDTDLIRSIELRNLECWNALLARSELTRRRLKGAVALGAPMIFAAHSQKMSRVGGRGWVAAGDAAMTFDPLSSQGIAKALRSGKLASFVAVDFLRRGAETHERYATMAAGEYADYEAAKRDYYREEQRWPASLFWSRRHAEVSQPAID